MRTRSVPLDARRVRWGVVAATAVAIFVASVVVDPGPSSQGPLGPWLDEALHTLAYATLALALGHATAGWSVGAVRRVAVVVALAAGYGLLIEFAQAPVPYRQFSYADVAANAVGAVVGSGWVVVERRRRRQQ